MINKEDFGGICNGATNSSNIPNKVSYIDMLTPNSNKKTNEIYYFGTPPKKPDSLSNFLKGNKKK